MAGAPRVVLANARLLSILLSLGGLVSPQALVAAIAKRGRPRLLALAEPDLLFLRQRELAGLDASSFVAAITKRCMAAQATGAPPVHPGFQFQGDWLGVANFREAFHSEKSTSIAHLHLRSFSSVICQIVFTAAPCAMLSDEEIQQRRPVWLALSELWLDTELGDADMERIARVMTLSGLSLEELRRVYLVEVAPVVYLNTWTVAGEWAGFAPDWLEERILFNRRHRWRRIRFWAWFPLTRSWMTHASERQWEKISRRVAQCRSTPEEG